ncbi:MAG: hypothetical protein ACSLFI_06260 [Solirubrobacterales bacterium]
MEISSRSTRLSVVDLTADGAERITERCHSITAKLDNSERLIALVMAEIEIARDLGAETIEVVADRVLRGSRLIRLVERASRAMGTGGIRIPAEHESVAAAFLGASRPRQTEFDTPVAVAVIGEAAIGIGVGTAGLNPVWIGSRPVGADTISRKARFSNPPRPNQVEAAISGASRKIESLAPPSTSRLLVSSDFSPVIERLCGSSITHDDARRGLASILGQTNDDLAAWFGLEPGRSRFLTGTLVGIAALADVFRLPVEPVAFDSVAGRHWSDECSRLVAGGSA